VVAAEPRHRCRRAIIGTRSDADANAASATSRLDSADHVPHGFWKEFRRWVLGINREAFLVGEVFWEDHANLVEDYETTLALKETGWGVTSNQLCIAYTDLMPTLRELQAQRERWARGTGLVLAVSTYNCVILSFCAGSPIRYLCFPSAAGVNLVITRLAPEKLTVIVLTNSSRGYTRFYSRGVAAIYAPWSHDFWASDEIDFREKHQK